MTATVMAELRGRVACLTLNRPQALNALSLDMVRALTQALLAWREDSAVLAVALRGQGKEGPFGAFCAGGDIRFFHQAALSDDPKLGQFFTEEYRLNHLIHTYPKPVIALMDGIVMGGGMGLAQGASLRLATERSRLAMPETLIGLFPDVGGGYFLSRCPGHVGEYLGLTGRSLGAADALAVGLADGVVESARLPGLWESLGQTPFENGAAVVHWCRSHQQRHHAATTLPLSDIDAVFGQARWEDVVDALQTHNSEWSQTTLATLRQRSPLMLRVVWAQIRRARGMALADELRLERDMVEHCFDTQHLHRRGASSETVEGIRALAVDKDHTPQWQPQRWEDVTPSMVDPFFVSPWASSEHPLRDLGMA
jgi:enoyl-CoA hydratase